MSSTVIVACLCLQNFSFLIPIKNVLPIVVIASSLSGVRAFIGQNLKTVEKSMEKCGTHIHTYIHTYLGEFGFHIFRYPLYICFVMVSFLLLQLYVKNCITQVAIKN